MKNRTTSASKQKGFSLLTGFLLVIILFGALAFFLAGRGINTAFGTTYANSSKVSSLISSAAYLRTGFDSVVLSGTAPASVSFDEAATTGIFNIDTGAATKQAVDPTLLASAVADPKGYWVFGSNVAGMASIGTAASDYTVMVAGLKKGICQQLNNTLNGTALTAEPVVTTGVTTAALLPSVTSVSPLVAFNTASVAIPAAGQASGCYATTTGDFVFIHTVYAQ